MRTHRFIFTIAIIATTASVAVAKPNVVLILTDDIGYADFGCYGAKDIKTPNVDKLAKQGVRFTDFYSNGPVCTPTRAGLMTGRWQQRVGLEWAIFPGQRDPGLPTSEVILARMLKNAGYATGLFGKWHLGYKPEFSPIAHGFDEFFGLKSGNVDHYSHKERIGDLDWYEGDKLADAKGYSTDIITERAVQFVRKNAKRPFFMYVPYNAAHWPFQPPNKPGDIREDKTWYDGTRKEYAAMVERIDLGVGKIMDELDKSGIADSTVFIFTNDNGGERLSDNRPFFHRKATLWEGGIRVPCVIRWKEGKIPAGTDTRQVAISMDLAATILSACEVKPPEGRKLDGIDLLNLIRHDNAETRTLYWRIDRKDRSQKAVRHGNWKWLRDGVIELVYDLEKDPGERQDLYQSQQEKAAALRKLHEDWEAEMAKEKPAFVVK
jgi:arylsulfatase A-like enzyme